MYSPLFTEVDLEYLRHQRLAEAEHERLIRSVDKSAFEGRSLSFSKFVRHLEERLHRKPVVQTNDRIRIQNPKQSQLSS